MFDLPAPTPRPYDLREKNVEPEQALKGSYPFLTIFIALHHSFATFFFPLSSDVTNVRTYVKIT